MKPKTISEALFPARGLIELEELQRVTEKEQLSLGLRGSKARNGAKDGNTRDQTGRNDCGKREGRDISSRKRQLLLQSPLKYALRHHAYDLVVMHLRGKDYVKWPDKLHAPYSRRDITKYCKFHYDHGHFTVDHCKALRAEILKCSNRDS